MSNKDQINQLINGIALFDKQVIKNKCLKFKAALKKERSKMLEKYYAKQNVEAFSIREKCRKSLWYRFKLKHGVTADVDQMSNQDVLKNEYDKSVKDFNLEESIRLLEFVFGDEDIALYKRDAEKLCDELVSVCDVLKGDDIWISSQAWGKINENI